MIIEFLFDGKIYARRKRKVTFLSHTSAATAVFAERLFNAQKQQKSSNRIAGLIRKIWVLCVRLLNSQMWNKRFRFRKQICNGKQADVL